MLRSLVSRKGFDPECLRFESSSIRDDCKDEITYHYLGTRLADLYEELENPTPQGLLEEWLHRRSGARYVMLATMIGVLFALLLGSLALAVSVFQAYVGYQAWKHPVQN